MPEAELQLPHSGVFVRGHGTVVEKRTVPPKPQPPPEEIYIFEEIEARCELLHNGKSLKYIQTLNDFYGLETSVKTAINEMKEFANTEGIGPNSDLQVVVVRIVHQFAAKPTDKENFYDRRFPDFYRTECDDLSEDVETVVWSSRKI